MGKLSGKVAVVTGASKGIGAGIAKALAAEGAAVVVNYASSREGADKVVADITSKGGKAIAVGGDVAKPADVKSLFDATKKAFGKVDVLVNNAGVYKFAPIAFAMPAPMPFDAPVTTTTLPFNLLMGVLLVLRLGIGHPGPCAAGSMLRQSSN